MFFFVVQDLMVATGEVTGFDLAKKKVEVCTKKGEFNDADGDHFDHDVDCDADYD